MKCNPMTAGTGIALGVALGTALGVAFGHMGVWLAIGAGVGVLLPSLDVMFWSHSEASEKQTGGRS